MLPWLDLMRAMTLLPPAGGPVRATFAPPPAVLGPLAAWAPVWSVAFDASRTPWAAAGLAFGPWALAWRIGQEGRE